jgi:protocatechuate 3,4-dioxygenase beta subunit
MTSRALAGRDPVFRSGADPLSRAEFDTAVRLQRGGHLTCVRTPESVDGPFYYESSPLRSSIAEGQPGIPLRLGITVANAHLGGDRCTPLGGALVDVWQTNAQGLYSNVGPDLQVEDTRGQTFLRGHQLTDQKGYVEFDTIVPGWEIVPAPTVRGVIARTTHVHVKVFSEHKVVTTQLYFPDPLMDAIYASQEPYRSHGQLMVPGSAKHYGRIHNGDDQEYTFDRAKPMPVMREGKRLLAKATIGIVTMGHVGFKPYFR